MKGEEEEKRRIYEEIYAKNIKLFQCITLSLFIIVLPYLILIFLAYISSYLLPHTIDFSNYFCIISLLFYLSVFSVQIFLPISDMSQ